MKWSRRRRWRWRCRRWAVGSDGSNEWIWMHDLHKHWEGRRQESGQRVGREWESNERERERGKQRARRLACFAAPALTAVAVVVVAPLRQLLLLLPLLFFFAYFLFTVAWLLCVCAWRRHRVFNKSMWMMRKVSRQLKAEWRRGGRGEAWTKTRWGGYTTTTNRCACASACVCVCVRGIPRNETVFLLRHKTHMCISGAQGRDETQWNRRWRAAGLRCVCVCVWEMAMQLYEVCKGCVMRVPQISV